MTTLSVERLRAELIALVDQVSDAVGMPDSTISRAVFGDSGFVKRLRKGGNFTVANAEILERWLRDQLASVASVEPAE